MGETTTVKQGSSLMVPSVMLCEGRSFSCHMLLNSCVAHVTGATAAAAAAAAAADMQHSQCLLWCGSNRVATHGIWRHICEAFTYDL